MRASQRRSDVSTLDLTELERRLRAWRRRQGERARLPDWVWDEAAGLARALGASRVSRQLHLDYYKLCRRAQGRGSPAVGPGPVAFVELAAGPSWPGEAGQLRAEMSSPSGSTLTLHLGRDVGAVVALAQAFWRRKP